MCRLPGHQGCAGVGFFRGLCLCSDGLQGAEWGGQASADAGVCFEPIGDVGHQGSARGDPGGGREGVSCITTVLTKQ